jgi:hypothetical protein
MAVQFGLDPGGSNHLKMGEYILSPYREVYGAIPRSGVGEFYIALSSRPYLQ